MQRNGDHHQICASLPRMHGLRCFVLHDWESFLPLHPLLVQAFRENTNLETLPGLDASRYNEFINEITKIMSFLFRNRTMRQARSLLALQPQTGMPFGSKSGIWYMVMERLGRDRAGASAIFQILSRRPAIFEVQRRRPAAVAMPQQKSAACPQRQQETCGNCGTTLPL
jgi:hypothetical protein